jgi:hypothetical protein
MVKLKLQYNGLPSLLLVLKKRKNEVPKLLVLPLKIMELALQRIITDLLKGNILLIKLIEVV